MKEIKVISLNLVLLLSFQFSLTNIQAQNEEYPIKIGEKIHYQVTKLRKNNEIVNTKLILSGLNLTEETRFYLEVKSIHGVLDAFGTIIIYTVNGNQLQFGYSMFHMNPNISYLNDYYIAHENQRPNLKYAFDKNNFILTENFTEQDRIYKYDLSDGYLFYWENFINTKENELDYDHFIIERYFPNSTDRDNLFLIISILMTLVVWRIKRV